MSPATRGFMESLVDDGPAQPVGRERSLSAVEVAKLEAVAEVEAAVASGKDALQFDVALSISSFDHDGLGRYGDPVDPKGDIKAMQEAQALLKPGGLMFLTVPVGPDILVWNLHRRYGEHRLPLLLGGWEEVERALRSRIFSPPVGAC